MCFGARSCRMLGISTILQNENSEGADLHFFYEWKTTALLGCRVRFIAESAGCPTRWWVAATNLSQPLMVFVSQIWLDFDSSPNLVFFASTEIYPFSLNSQRQARIFCGMTARDAFFLFEKGDPREGAEEDDPLYSSKASLH